MTPYTELKYKNHMFSACDVKNAVGPQVWRKHRMCPVRASVRNSKTSVHISALRGIQGLLWSFKGGTYQALWASEYTASEVLSGQSFGNNHHKHLHKKNHYFSEKLFSKIVKMIIKLLDF